MPAIRLHEEGVSGMTSVPFRVRERAATAAMAGQGDADDPATPRCRPRDSRPLTIVV